MSFSPRTDSGVSKLYGAIWTASMVTSTSEAWLNALFYDLAALSFEISKLVALSTSPLAP